MTEAKDMWSSNREPSAHKTHGSRKAVYIAIAVALIIVGALVAFVFLSGVLQPRVIPEIADVTLGFDDYGRTYRYFVTVHNNGASGDVKVFFELKAVQSGNVGFAQTQDKTVHLDSGGSTTLTFEFHYNFSTKSKNRLRRTDRRPLSLPASSHQIV
jgi:hypothetical protein